MRFSWLPPALAATLFGCGWLTFQQAAAQAPNDLVVPQPAAVALANPAPVHQDATTTGRIEAVTVYRGQALVTRSIDVPGPAGLREVVVTELPARIDPNSLFAESGPAIEIRSVRYRARPIAQDAREEIRALDTKLRAAREQLEGNTAHTAALNDHVQYLNKLEGFVAPTATVELSKGVLNAQTVKDLSTFMLTERQRVVTESLKLRNEAKVLSEQISLLERELATVSGRSSRQVQEAVVFVDVKQANGGNLHLRYLVDSATWSPSYNVRTEADRKEVRVEYQASIEQMSGEDWTDVNMTLSTATPSLVARAPVLNPLTVMLARGGNNEQQRGQSKDYVGSKMQLENQLKAVENRRAQNGNNFNNPGQQQGLQVDSNGDGDIDLRLNSVAGELQWLDFVAEGKIDRSVAAATKDEGLSVTYQLAGRSTLPSRSDRQLIRIAALPLKGSFYKLAVPLLTNYVYEEANVTNSSTNVLLAGPVSAFVAGQFVGHGEIPTVAVGESFTVGFGIDSSLRAARELVSRTEQIQGGNRVVSFTYRLTIENFGTDPAKVRLLDRLPNANGSEIKITLGENLRELSVDPVYQTTQRKKGLLRWEAEVPAAANGAKAFTLDYAFQAEYDKQLSIAGLPVSK